MVLETRLNLCRAQHLFIIHHSSYSLSVGSVILILADVSILSYMFVIYLIYLHVFPCPISKMTAVMKEYPIYLIIFGVHSKSEFLWHSHCHMLKDILRFICDIIFIIEERQPYQLIINKRQKQSTGYIKYVDSHFVNRYVNWFWNYMVFCCIDIMKNTVCYKSAEE